MLPANQARSASSAGDVRASHSQQSCDAYSNGKRSGPTGCLLACEHTGARAEWTPADWERHVRQLVVIFQGS